MKILKIGSKRTTLFKPKKLGRYINDHTLIYNCKWYITTCGWQKSSFTKVALKIASLEWI